MLRHRIRFLDFSSTSRRLHKEGLSAQHSRAKCDRNQLPPFTLSPVNAASGLARGDLHLIPNVLDAASADRKAISKLPPTAPDVTVWRVEILDDGFSAHVQFAGQGAWRCTGCCSQGPCKGKEQVVSHSPDPLTRGCAEFFGFSLAFRQSVANSLPRKNPFSNCHDGPRRPP